MRPPEIWAKCEGCDPEYAGHPPAHIAWSYEKEQWLCGECWYADEYDGVGGGYRFLRASETQLDLSEQTTRLIAAAAKHKLGVK